MVIRANHPIHESCDPWSALGTGQLGEGRTDPLAHRFDALGAGCAIPLWPRLGIALAQWVGHPVVRSGDLLVLPLAGIPVPPVGQRALQQPGALACELRQGLLESLPPCLGGRR